MEEDSKQPIIVKALGALGVSAGGAGIAAVLFGGFWILLAVVLITFALIFGAYFGWRWWRRRQRSASFARTLESEGTGAIGPGSAETKRALDDLRSKFQSGVEDFRSSTGLSLYELPWYVIIGESGAGKTEAVRAGLQDKIGSGYRHHVPGKGGTVNMNWWFTGQAVILDTAGKMVVPEKGQESESAEWREFLRLLRKARPHCPINGLLFVLSAESLIKDSAEKIRDKAHKLSQQLVVIQKNLDVRFPVYVMITKCDLLTGFREFCDEIGDLTAQEQILGWSNPDPLDKPFKPELIEEHLASVAARIRRRRLALLREGISGSDRFEDASLYGNSTPSSPPRAADARDSLFALPDSLCRLAPRLKRYLESIFQQGVLAPKAVFLRGIYFSSSMRDGSALDEALALATGLSLDQVSTVHSVTENRAFFLKDMFESKVFPEFRLVTRHRNTQKVLRRRRLTLYGTATAVLVGMLGFTYYGNRDLRRTIGNELGLWQYGAQGWTDQGEWRPGLLAALDNGRWEYRGDQELAGRDAPKVTLERFHRDLADLARTNLSPGLIFALARSMASRGTDQGRREKAQRYLFEAGFVRPLVRLTREQMSQRPPSNLKEEQAHSSALAALIRLESRLNNNSATPGYHRDEARQLVEDCFRYLFPEHTPDVWVGLFQRTHSEVGPNLARAGDSLERNRPIAAGLKALQEASQRAQANVNQRLLSLNELTEALERYRSAESNWLATVSSDPAAALAQYAEGLGAAWTMVSGALATVKPAQPGITAMPEVLPVESLEKEFADLQLTAGQVSEGVFTNILASLGNEPQGLFREIHESVTDFTKSETQRLAEQWLQRSNSVVDLDERFLKRVGPEPAMGSRQRLYQTAVSVATNRPAFSTNDVGGGWAEYLGFRQAPPQVEYAGPLAAPATNAVARVMAAAVAGLQRDYANQYGENVRALLVQHSGVNPINTGLSNAFAFLGRVSADVGHTSGPPALRISLSNELAQARRRLVDRYVTDRKEKLKDADRFPVNLRGQLDQPLRVEDLVNLREQLREVGAETNLFVRSLFVEEDHRRLNELGHLLKREAVIEAILDGDRIRKGSIEFPRDYREDQPAEEISDASVRYLFYHDGLKGSYTDLTSPDPIREIALDAALSLRLSRKDNSPRQDEVGRAWELLAMISDRETKRIEDNKWEVIARVAVDGGESDKLPLKLIISLDKELPLPGD